MAYIRKYIQDYESVCRKLNAENKDKDIIYAMSPVNTICFGRYQVELIEMLNNPLHTESSIIDCVSSHSAIYPDFNKDYVIRKIIIKREKSGIRLNVDDQFEYPYR